MFLPLISQNKGMKRRHFIENFLMSPHILLGICLVFVVFHLIADGTALKIWKLSQKEADLIDNINYLEKKSSDISLEIQKYYKPDYLKRIATERFDLLQEHDLIFVFSEGSFSESQKSKRRIDKF